MRALSVELATAMERKGDEDGARIKLAAFDMDGVLIDHVSSWGAVHDALGTRNREAMTAFLEGRSAHGAARPGDHLRHCHGRPARHG
jgi:phosphoserine phosphatase